jgi:hypothetical protein
MNYSFAAMEAIKKRFRGHPSKFFMENPESYLGPNYAAVINFWTFHDSLTYSQYHQVSNRWVKITHKHKAVTQECKTFLNEIGSLILDVNECFILRWSFNSEQETTEEIILMHKLLEKGNYEMPFVKLYDNLDT